jgi:hypothetical protein
MGMRMGNGSIIGTAACLLLAPQLHGQTQVIQTQAAQTQVVQSTRCQPGTRTQEPGPPQPSERARGYDIVVEVPDLCVSRIHLLVRGLDAHLALNARVANLVRLNAGADVFLNAVDVTIDSVRAEALVLVDLDNVAYIVDQTMQFIDNHPELVAGVFRTVQGAVGTVGTVANTALQPGGVVSQTVSTLGRTLDSITAPGGFLTRTVNSLGQTLVRTVDATGAILEHTVDTAGRIIGHNVVGNVLQLPLLSQTTGTAGQTLRRVQDAGGAIIEYAVDPAGKIINAQVVEPSR